VFYLHGNDVAAIGLMNKIGLKFLKTAIGIAVWAVLIAPNAYGDPLVFSNVVALQNEGSTQVDLFGNPNTTLTGPNISFLVTIAGTLPASGTDTLQITFTEAGRPPVVQTFTIPIFPGVTLPYSQIFSVNFFNATTLGTTATLTLDILGNTSDFVIPNTGQSVDGYTFTFSGAQPIPEPVTVTLLGIGLTGVSAERYRRRKRKSRSQT
jgi:hypothetical protein